MISTPNKGGDSSRVSLTADAATPEEPSVGIYKALLADISAALAEVRAAANLIGIAALNPHGAHDDEGLWRAEGMKAAADIIEAAIAKATPASLPHEQTRGEG